MLRIDCPWCGPRDEPEFVCGGESHVTRPPFDRSDDRAWADYLYFRKNPKGVHHERWLHLHGCRQWFNVARDTRTHAIRAVYRMGERPPELDL
ncbi:MAG: sarcosine oxidase subunit delta [Devosia sp.]|nr:sarcosine oxidase subunit delta [Devosia sp.]